MRARQRTRAGRRRWLLPVPVLVTALATGCAAGSAGTTPTAGASTGASRPSWISVAQGAPTPSATSIGWPSPSATPIGGYLPLASPAAVTSTTPQPRCTDLNWHAGQINGLSAVPGPGTATVSWRDSGASNVLGYRVSATSQHLLNGRQRNPVATMVKATGSCAQLTATVRGLYRRTPYTVTVEVIYTHQNTDSPRITTVARSTVTTTT